MEVGLGKRDGEGGIYQETGQREKKGLRNPVCFRGWERD